MMNWKLILNITSSINGGLITGAALLQTLIGQDLTIKAVAFLGICQIIISSINTQLSTQTNNIKDVAAIQGDDGKPAVRINVNANAPQNLAAVAIDPAQPNIGAANADVRAVLTAKAS
jgi:hypothetical protein